VTLTAASAAPEAASVTIPVSRYVAAGATVNVREPFVCAYVALISTDPTLTPVTASPFTVATDVFDDLHTARDLTISFDPSGPTAIAVN
jgi:hypothetical protein